MYIQRRVHLKVAKDMGFTDRLLDAVDSLETISGVEEIDEEISGYIKLEGPVADVEIGLGPGLTLGRIVYLRVNKEVQIKMDDESNTPYVVKPPCSGVDGILYLEGDFNKVFFSYSGDEELSLFYAIVGS